LDRVLNAFPVQNGLDDVAHGVAQFNGSWSNPSTINSTSVRLDQVVTDKVSVFFRFSNTTSDSSLRGFNGPPSVKTVQAYTTRTYTGGATALLSSHLGNDFRINYSSNYTTSTDSTDAFGGNTPVALSQLTGLGPGSSGETEFFLGPQFVFLAETNERAAQRQWNLVDTVSYSTGHHQLKFGVDYRRLMPFAIGSNPGAVYFYDASVDPTPVQTNSADFAFFTTTLPAHPLFTNFSLFAEDDWKINNRLSFSFGLRWDVNPAPSASQGLPGNTLTGTGPADWALAPQGTSLWKTTWFNFAPRLGVAYAIRDKPGWETVLRAGGGLFFDTGQQLGSFSFHGPGFSGENDLFGTSFPCAPAPCSASDLVPPVQTTGPFFALGGFYPRLQVPYTIQWNASVEQALGQSQALTLSYVGSHAGRLLEQDQVPADPTNPIANEFFFVRNGLTSDYDALQIQFNRRLTRGLTALASYTWSHCLDWGSQNYTIGYDRGSCDADVRHNLTGAVSYDLPNVGHGSFVSVLLHHWGVDDRFTARSAFPVNVLGTTEIDPNTGRQLSNGLNFTGTPIYLYGAQCDATYATDFGATLPCPGGRAINPDAFTSVASGRGNVPRNFVRGFGAWQMDLAVRREFQIREGLKLQFRAEAFNLFNHPNFGTIDAGCGSPGNGGGPLGCSNSTFGQTTATLANSLTGILSPLYQMGGARSMQFALKLVF
jgi:hypothetical protein